MIIDLILDRKDGVQYNAKDFYINVLENENIFEFPHDISISLDYGNNKDVQKALCDYIDNCGYNPEIKDYINSVNWIVNDSEHDYTDIEHCKNCIKCAAIAHQEINNINIEKLIENKTKEIFPDNVMHEIQNNTINAIFSVIDNYI